MPLVATPVVPVEVLAWPIIAASVGLTPRAACNPANADCAGLVAGVEKDCEVSLEI
jgi:hypothetical protein